MRIAYMSDLHLEFEAARMRQDGWEEFDAARRNFSGHPDRGPLLEPILGVDLVVLAGDIDTGTQGIRYADAVATFLGVPVVYVAGNHEHYHGDLSHLATQLRAAAQATDGRVFYLDHDSVDLQLAGEAVTVLGCTLWTDYQLEGDDAEAMRRAQQWMRDFALITLDDRPFTPVDALGRHRRARAWLDTEFARLRTTNHSRVIVVSHHAPIPVTLEARVAAVAPCYASDLRGAIARWRPDVWFHGHSHRRHLTRYQDSWIAAAPLGYPDGTAINRAYIPGLLEL